MIKANLVYDALKADILHGKLRPGDIFPSEKALCSRFHMSRGTVRASLRRLAAEGLLATHQGKHRRVRELDPVPLPKLRLGKSTSFGSYLKELGRHRGWLPQDIIRKYPSETPWFQIDDAPRLSPDEIRKRLVLSASGKIIWFLRQRMAGGVALALQWVVVPQRLIPHIDAGALRPGGITELYEGSYGIHRDTVDAHYRPVAASRVESRWLDVLFESPLIEERRTSYMRLGNSLEGRLVPYEYLLSLYTDRVTLDFGWHDQTPRPAAHDACMKEAEERKRHARHGNCS